MRCSLAKAVKFMQLPDLLRKREPDTHKNNYGHVLVIGGSPGLTGAVCLCAQAALRIGAGLVTAGVPGSLNNIIEIKLTEVMSIPLPEESGYLALKSFKSIQNILEKINVIALGCGATTIVSCREFVFKILSEVDKPIVLDADGINAVASDGEVLNRRRTKRLVLTPHQGEFSRLIKRDVSYIKENRKELAKDFALRYNLTLVLKGHRTLVTDGKEFFENETGNPGMATAGSGDVLTGIIAGLAAQGLDLWNAAKTGVYLSGLAGDLAVEEMTQSCLIASDIIDYLPDAVKRSLKEK